MKKRCKFLICIAFFLRVLVVFFGLVAVLVASGKSTQKCDIQRALKFAPDLGEAL
jgi:hypothetical protein